ncbi:hypothetical protein AVEN_64275-1, partial [Araneus ventricosus]
VTLRLRFFPQFLGPRSVRCPLAPKFPQERTTYEPFRAGRERAEMLSRVIKYKRACATAGQKTARGDDLPGDHQRNPLLFSSNDEMRNRARLPVGSCGQQPDKSLRLNLSATPHRG